MGRMIRAAVVAAALAKGVLAQTPGNSVNCGPGSLCPEETPCCGQYGQCGIGAYCLGGCDPKYSNSLESCVPAPVCESKDYSFGDLKGIQPNTKYLGDATKADWVSSGSPLAYNGQVLLTMNEGSVGTLLASNHYVWYGKVSAKLKTSAGKGVVTAFILLSDVKDEIDFEFVGTDLETAQTNFYSQGVTNYNNGGKSGGLANTQSTEHEYEIDWTPESIKWSIDGKEVRSVEKADTWNATSNRYDYPQTPSRVQLSLWPAGLPTNGEGTIKWGGGLVEWDSSYMQNGYYFASFSEVKIQCYQPPPGANVKGKISYTYDDVSATNDSVVIGNKPTVLKSLLGTGTDMEADYANSSPSSTPSDQATVPGLSGAGPGTNGQRGDGGGSSGGDGGSGTDTSSDAQPTGDTSDFDQGRGTSTGGASTVSRPEGIVQGSLFAIVVAFVGLVAL